MSNQAELGTSSHRGGVRSTNPPTHTPPRAFLAWLQPNTTDDALPTGGQGRGHSHGPSWRLWGPHEVLKFVRCAGAGGHLGGGGGLVRAGARYDLIHIVAY